MSGLTWQQGGAAILWSGAGLLALAMLAAGAGYWWRGREHRRAVRREISGMIGEAGRRERDLPRLSRAIGETERRTRAMDLGGLVDPPHSDHIGDRTPTQAIPRCEFCHYLAVIGDPEKCACPRPCGASWCSALRRQV